MTHQLQLILFHLPVRGGEVSVTINHQIGFLTRINDLNSNEIRRLCPALDMDFLILFYGLPDSMEYVLLMY